MRTPWLYATAPIACLPIAHWYVFRGDWLWWGYGIRPATTPRMESGSISRWVWDGVRAGSARATSASASSFTSRNSTTPRATRSAKEVSPALTAAVCALVSRGSPASQMMIGRHTRPPSAAMWTHPSPGGAHTETYGLTRPPRRRERSADTSVPGEAWQPRMQPLSRTTAEPDACVSPPANPSAGSTPSASARAARGPSSPSVVTCVSRARFLTRPQLSPSGVSAGHRRPHCEGCRARGPDTLRVRSNWEVMRVIMPSVAMKDSRLSACVTPLRSMRKRRMVQLPEAMAPSNPAVMVSVRNILAASNAPARCALDSIASAWRFRSALRRLNRSSNSRPSRPPASSSRLAPQ